MMRRFTIDGRWYTITPAAKAFGVSPQLVRDRLNKLGNELTAADLQKKVTNANIATGIPRRKVGDIGVGTWESKNL